ncbi:acetylcholinesterase-like isoform X2 [Haemaphysalis longicornis]
MLLWNRSRHYVAIQMMLTFSAVISGYVMHKENVQNTLDARRDDWGVIVNTTKGLVRGFVSESSFGRQVRVFYGIPYAQPPIAGLRFSSPEPNTPWSHILDATIKPNSCVQAIDEFYGNFSGSVMWNANTNMSEDCLKLNVWAPISPIECVAVLVWIYGGGFYSGTSTLDVYDARRLVAEENVIVVSMNYRVASLGFLSFGDELMPGNAGLYDQLLALQWVRENIRAFGGDPTRVTLFGESAGAASVGVHLLSPLSRSLFQGAILQSASPTVPWGFHDKETAREAARRLAKAMKCSESLDHSTINCLRRKNPNDLVQNESNKGGVVDFAFTPVEDGKLIRNFTQALKEARPFLRTVPVLLGSNVNEGSYFLQYFFGFSEKEECPEVTADNFTAAIQSLDPVLGHPPMEAILKMYTGNVTPTTSGGKLDILDSIVGDYHFTCPVVHLADILTQFGVLVYQYVFARRSSRNPWPLWMGVIHGEEIAFEFGEPFNASQRYDKEDKDLSGLVMHYWANFAKSGNPNEHDADHTVPSPVPTWPRRTSSGREHLVLNVSSIMGHAHRAVYCAFWESVRQNRTTTQRAEG